MYLKDILETIIYVFLIISDIYLCGVGEISKDTFYFILYFIVLIFIPRWLDD